jgi:hypothetical protein
MSNLNLRVNNTVMDVSQIPIIFRKGIINYNDPTVRTKDYSYIFNIPKTKESNIAFGNASGKGLGKFAIPTFNAILFDSFDSVFSGVIELTGERDFDYQVLLRTNLLEIKDLLEGKSLRDLNFEDVDFDITNAENLIAAHIEGTSLVSEHIEFPFMQFERFYTPIDIFETYNQVLERGFRRSTFLGALNNPLIKRFCLFQRAGSIESPLYYEYFPPATKLVSILYQMFDDIGYRLTGSFLNDKTVKTIIIPYLQTVDNWQIGFDSGIKPELDENLLISFRAWVDSTINRRSYSSTTFENVIYDLVLEDIQEQINDTTWVFKSGGVYNTELRFESQWIGKESNVSNANFKADIRIVSSINGVLAETNLDNIALIRNVKRLVIDLQYKLADEEEITVQVRHNAAIELFIARFSSFPTLELSGDLMSIRNWQNDIPQLEFLRNIINYFNLYFEIDIDNKTFQLDLPADFFTSTGVIDLTDKTQDTINYKALTSDEKNIKLRFQPTDMDLPYQIFTTNLKRLAVGNFPNFKELNGRLSSEFIESNFNREPLEGKVFNSIFSFVNVEQLFVVNNTNISNNNDWILEPTKIPKFINLNRIKKDWNNGWITDGDEAEAALLEPSEIEYPGTICLLKYYGVLPDENQTKINLGGNLIPVPISDFCGHYRSPRGFNFFGNGDGSLQNVVASMDRRYDPQAFFGDFQAIQLSFDKTPNNVYDVCWRITHGELENAYIAEFVVDTDTTLYNQLRPNTDIRINNIIYNIVDIVFEPLLKLSRMTLKTKT